MSKMIHLFIFALFGFSSLSVASAANAQNGGGDFLDYLSMEYAKYGRREARKKDYKDSRYFRELSQKAKAGHMVYPAALSSRQIPTEQLRELNNAKEKLDYHLNLGARARAPFAAAAAQASYESWLEEAEENRSNADVDEAKANFYSHLAAVSIPQSTTIIYFPVNSAQLTKDSRTKLNAMIKEMKAHNTQDIALATHASTTASHTYNLNLTKKRADAVQRYLRNHGVDSNVILRTYGEGDLALPTADGKENQLNRRAVLSFVSKKAPK